MTHSLQEPLALVLQALRQDPLAAFDVSRVEAAVKAVARVDRPAGKALAKFLENHPRPSCGLLLQHCIEDPKFASLKAPAEVLLYMGEVTDPFLVRVAPGPQPKRAVLCLLVAEDERRIYAGESKGKLSVWSVDTGEHLEDRKVCSRALTHVTRSGSTLRALEAGGTVHQAEGAGRKFSKLLAAPGELHQLAGPYLLWWDRDPEGELQTLRWTNLETDARQEVTVPTPWRGWLCLDDVRQVLVAQGASLQLWDLETGELTATVPLPPGHTFEQMHRDDEGGLYLVLDRSGTRVRGRLLLDDRRLTLLDDLDTRDPGWALFRRAAQWLEPGRAFVPASTSELRAADGALITEYVIFEDHNQLTTAVHRGTGRIIVAGKNIPMPLLVLQRYAGRKEETATHAPLALNWAEPGTQLTVTVDDIDASDAFLVRVLEAAPALTLELTRDGSPAAQVTHGMGALESASRFTRFLQDYDFEAGARIDDALPPFMLSREAFRALRAHETIRYRSPWVGEEVLLGPAQPGSANLEVRGQPRVVGTLVAQGDGVRWVVLDEPQWPLLLEREELDGQCCVRVERID